MAITFQRSADWQEGGQEGKRQIVKAGTLTGDGAANSVDASVLGLTKFTSSFYLINMDSAVSGANFLVAEKSTDGTSATIRRPVSAADGQPITWELHAPANGEAYEVRVYGE